MAYVFKVGDKAKYVGKGQYDGGIVTITEVSRVAAGKPPFDLAGAAETDGGVGLFHDYELVPIFEVKAAILPSDSADRKKIPVGTGVLDYFSSALAAVARVSHAGNEQHNPGQPLHWARGKSNDHADTMIRHFLERGTDDVDGMPHSAKMAWRALAILQQELEDKGAPISRGSK